MIDPKIDESVADKIKDLLANPNDRIKLDDHVTEILRKAIEAFGADSFWNSLPLLNADGIQQRLAQYEQLSSDLLTAAILIGRWGNVDQVMLLEKVFARLAEVNKVSNGLTVWSGMRYYPICLLMYAAGIAALAARNYPILTAIFQTRVKSLTIAQGQDELIVRVLNEMTDLDDAFKILPAYARQYVPRSRYFFNILQTEMDRLLFLGDSYERVFDEYEIISALVYADMTSEERGRVWAMPGIFAYKSRLAEAGPLQVFAADSENKGEEMPLVKIGLFGSSSKRLNEIARAYMEFISQLRRY